MGEFLLTRPPFLPRSSQRVAAPPISSSSSPHPGQPGFRRLDMDSDILSSSPSPFPRIRLKLKTDLPSSTTSNQTTPRDYIRSPLTSIPEELAIKGEGDMDVDTDLNDMPVLEDINSSDYALPSLPGSFPNSSNSFNQGYSPSTPSSQRIMKTISLSHADPPNCPAK